MFYNVRNNHRKIINLAIGLPKIMDDNQGKEMTTGICKNKVEEAILTKNGFLDDGVADLKHHGGPDRAVCIYPFEHYSFWQQEFGIQLPTAAFGENLTVTHMLEEDVCIGDIYQIGESVIQITQSRIPCNTISKRTGVPNLLEKMVETGFTGYLSRVLKEGTIRKNSDIVLIKRHPKQCSVLFSHQIYLHNPNDIDGIKRLLAVKELANEWRKKMNKRIERLNS
ncbi:MOSC domain-containing protein [Terrilactibacillus laevilacticus]|uniref:MOSC domain-containing protein n=1 Tax=Terrilactibacillus laevilacticus TaxID=1380157 RepID=A0ABW5PUS2_9BACI|nr:MOSC domain-containing protein [Terrilactibacillus laevilacticus]